MTMKKALIASAVMASILITPAAFALKEHPADELATTSEMELTAVYLQPIDMGPRGMGLPAAKADVHPGVNIHAVEDNKNGLGAREWTPCLTISYTLVNNDTGEEQEGTFIPMVANDDPHYGANIRIVGMGNYKVTYHIEPPSKAEIHRHTDSETDIGCWWKLFDVSYESKCVGLS